MKVIIGAGQVEEAGWLATNQEVLNLLDRQSFEAFFKEKKAQALLAEHVWEHLTIAEGKVAARNCYDFLEAGGYLRVAVPDGNFKDPIFQNLVQIGGPGPKEHPAYTHRVLYDYQTFKAVFEETGFEVKLLEYCNEEGVFHYNYWNPQDGLIGRSLRYDTRNSRQHLGMVSIILDAYKPFCLNTRA